MKTTKNLTAAKKLNKQEMKSLVGGTVTIIGQLDSMRGPRMLDANLEAE